MRSSLLFVLAIIFYFSGQACAGDETQSIKPPFGFSFGDTERVTNDKICNNDLVVSVDRKSKAEYCNNIGYEFAANYDNMLVRYINGEREYNLDGYVIISSHLKSISLNGVEINGVKFNVVVELSNVSKDYDTYLVTSKIDNMVKLKANNKDYLLSWVVSRVSYVMSGSSPVLFSSISEIQKVINDKYKNYFDENRSISHGGRYNYFYKDSGVEVALSYGEGSSGMASYCTISYDGSSYLSGLYKGYYGKHIKEMSTDKPKNTDLL